MVQNPRGSNTTYARTAWRATPVVAFCLPWFGRVGLSSPQEKPSLGPRVYSFLPLNNQNQITMTPAAQN